MFETIDEYLQKRLEKEFAKCGRVAKENEGAEMAELLQDAGYGVYPDEPAWRHTHFLEEQIVIYMKAINS